MKKGLISTFAIIACLGLAGCGTTNNKQAEESSEASSLKKDNAKLKSSINKKKQKEKEQNTSSSKVASTSSEKASNQAQQQTASQRKFDKSDPSTWHDIPYKGYPSYDAYCEANGGDPEVQAETASMQHAENVRRGIEDANGNETQNFQNWVSARDNAWDNGNDNFPDYDQNTQW